MSSVASSATSATKDFQLFKERALSKGFEAISVTIPGKHQTLDPVNLLFPTLDSLVVLNCKSSSELDEIIHRMTRNPLSITGLLEGCEYVLCPSTKKRKYDDQQLDAKITGSELPDTSPRCTSIEMMNNVLKLECEALVQIADDAKLWVVFSGDCNTDSSEDLITELHRAQTSALNLRSSPQSDCLKRAKLCNDIITYPGLPDYVSALREFDEERLFLARQRLKDLQNIYIVLAESIQRE